MNVLFMLLLSSHVGYAPLWKEQLKEEWNESKSLYEEEARWEVRAALDSIIADAYGLSREHYEHILRSFDRKSGPNPYTKLCLSKIDELHAIGREDFVKKYDPYHHILLVETLPSPIITLPDIVADPSVSIAKASRGKKVSAAPAVQSTLQF